MAQYIRSVKVAFKYSRPLASYCIARLCQLIFCTSLHKYFPPQLRILSFFLPLNYMCVKFRERNTHCFFFSWNSLNSSRLGFLNNERNTIKRYQSIDMTFFLLSLHTNSQFNEICLRKENHFQFT